MKKLFMFIVIAFFAAFLISCNNNEELGPEDGAAYSKCMIDYYIDCDSIIVTAIENTLKVSFDGNAFTGTKNNHDSFWEIAKSNNDTSYNNKVVHAIHASINDSIYAISIKCDRDIDDSHLAGAELNDLFTFEGRTVYNIIQNNYNRYDPDEIKMCAMDVTPSKTRVIYTECSLTLNNPPSQSGTYTFDVSLTLSKKTLKNTVQMEF